MMKQISQILCTLVVIGVTLFYTYQPVKAADFDDRAFFKAGIGYYMPSTKDWDEVYDGGIAQFSLGYSRYLIEKFGGNLGLEILAGYYSKSGETVGFEPETVDFLMIPLTISGILRFGEGSFIPYTGLGLVGAYYSEDSKAFDEKYIGYGVGAILKGGAEYELNRTFRLFGEVSYSYIAGSSDDKSLTEGSLDLGGLGAMLGIAFLVD
ncbi:hypothetical protein JXQ70_16060 [bacterium]|nr:hypothetical protein [bacterium]